MVPSSLPWLGFVGLLEARRRKQRRGHKRGERSGSERSNARPDRQTFLRFVLVRSILLALAGRADQARKARLSSKTNPPAGGNCEMHRGPGPPVSLTSLVGLASDGEDRLWAFCPQILNTSSRTAVRSLVVSFCAGIVNIARFGSAVCVHRALALGQANPRPDACAPVYGSMCSTTSFFASISKSDGVSVYPRTRDVSSLSCYICASLCHLPCDVPTL